MSKIFYWIVAATGGCWGFYLAANLKNGDFKDGLTAIVLIIVSAVLLEVGVNRRQA